MSTREQFEATLVCAYDPAWPITGKEDASERVAATDVQGQRRRSDEWDKRAEYPLLLREYTAFLKIIFTKVLTRMFELSKQEEAESARQVEAWTRVGSEPRERPNAHNA